MGRKKGESVGRVDVGMGEKVRQREEVVNKERGLSLSVELVSGSPC